MARAPLSRVADERDPVSTAVLAESLPGGVTFPERARHWYGAAVVVDGVKYRIQRYGEHGIEGRIVGLAELALAGPTWRANARVQSIETTALAWDKVAGVYRPIPESELRLLAGDR